MSRCISKCGHMHRTCKYLPTYLPANSCLHTTYTPTYLPAYTILCTILYYILYTIYYVLSTLYSILYTLYSILYTLYYTILYNTILYYTIAAWQVITTARFGATMPKFKSLGSRVWRPQTGGDFLGLLKLAVELQCIISPGKPRACMDPLT